MSESDYEPLGAREISECEAFNTDPDEGSLANSYVVVYRLESICGWLQEIAIQLAALREKR